MSISGRPIATRGEPLKVTISVDLALSCDFSGGGAENIIQAADAALYAAKAGGRNCVRVARSRARQNTVDITPREVTPVSK